MNLSILLASIFLLFLLKLLRDSLFYAWLWQIKEYRIDRMMAYLRENRNIIRNNSIYVFAIVMFISYFIFLKNYSLAFQYSVLAFFVFAILRILKEIKNKSLKRPRLTLKIVLIFFLEAVFYFSLFAFYWIPASAGMTKIEADEIMKFLLFIYVINPVFITIIILFINPFFNFQKRRIIKKATQKMKSLKKVKVIGITGSYGKTSTKEFLYAILSRKYKVVKTEGNNNTNIGVAYTVLNKVSDDYDYFICEMGAYKIGEIKEMCGIVGPEIGILTGINEQHMELFGSMENTIKAKFELIRALPENGLAVINEKLKVKNVKYFSLNNANNIKVYQDFVEFDYICHCEEHQRRSNPRTMPKELKNEIATLPSVARNDSSSVAKFKFNILGKHYIENVLSAIMVAEYLGMSLKEIKTAVEKIEPTEYMMRKIKGLNGSIFIDDSYSANPDGVVAALDYLKEAYPDYKKIIVFPGIIELGKESKKTHRKLFNRISEVCDIAYILDIGYWKLEIGNSLSAQRLHSPKGTMELTKECKFIFEKDFDKVANILKNNLDKNTVVLFESRGAGVVMGKLTKK